MAVAGGGAAFALTPKWSGSCAPVKPSVKLLRIERQHGRIPLVPFGKEPIRRRPCVALSDFARSIGSRTTSKRNVLSRILNHSGGHVVENLG
jgi:hypothetical protein